MKWAINYLGIHRCPSHNHLLHQAGARLPLLMPPQITQTMKVQYIGHGAVRSLLWLKRCAVGTLFLQRADRSCHDSMIGLSILPCSFEFIILPGVLLHSFCTMSFHQQQERGACLQHTFLICGRYACSSASWTPLTRCLAPEAAALTGQRANSKITAHPR